MRPALLPMWLIAALTLVFGATLAFAGELPEIRAHSALDFAVYKGDRLRVEVKASGQDLEVKWVLQGGTMCRKSVCEFDTGEWGLGLQRIGLVVFNPKGSLFLRYRIKVLAPPQGYKPGRVVPELVQAGAGIEGVSTEDFTVRTLTGRGYSYHQRKLQVVGPLPRILDWEEKLRTQPSSTMQFGRDDHEQHVLAGESAVLLAKAPSGRRAIVLTRGVVRSRVLDDKPPTWSVVVGSWLQIDTDEQGDIVVERLAGEGALVTVLRGNARVFRRKDSGESSKVVLGEATVIPQGASATFDKDQEEPSFLAVPPTKPLGERVKETTPFYMPGLSAVEQGQGASLIRGERPKKFGDALRAANASAKRRDWFKVIELLQSFGTDVKGNYFANLLLGEAYMQVFVHDVAADYLSQAAKKNVDAARPHHIFGMMALKERQWKRAMQHFADAADREGNEPHELQYYQGVAAFHARERVAAKSHFTYCLWEKSDGALADSAREFLKRVRDEGWLDLRFWIGAAFDSNVLRMSDEAAKALPGEIKKNKSAGYVAGAGFTIWAYRSESAGLSVAFDAAKHGWLEPTLAVVETLEQKFGLDLALAFGGGFRDAPFAVSLNGAAATTALGKERANDAVSGLVALSSPSLAGLTLLVTSNINSDPLPGRDDIFDPTLGEVVAVSERSSREAIYGFKVTPWDDEDGTFSLAARSASTVHRNEFSSGDDHKDLGIEMDVAVRPGFRQEFCLGVDYDKRDFSKSLDARKDTRTTPSLAWVWRYTTNLAQRVEVASESQTSTRSANSWKRLNAGLSLKLDL